MVLNSGGEPVFVGFKDWIIARKLTENLDITQTLRKFASHYDNFNDFQKSFLVDLNHGYYWHLTNDPNFTINPQKGPRDMSSIAKGQIREPGALMVTTHLDHWDDEYNNPEVTRPLAALIDLSDIDPRKLKQVDRGFGNEFYLTPELARQAKLVEIMPIEKARSLDKRLHSTLPTNKNELMNIWNSQHT